MIVFDSSTLILLARIDLLDMFIADYHGGIIIPEAVRSESVIAGKEDEPSILQHLQQKNISVFKVKDVGLVKRLKKDFSLDAGEAEALALALERQASIVAMDDRNAIRACKMLRLEFITAVAFLVRAAEKGLLSRERGMDKLQKLKSVGRYARAIIEDAARLIQGGANYGDEDVKHTDK